MKYFYKIIAVLILSLFTSNQLKSSAHINDDFKDKMFHALGSSNQGTQFYLTFHPCNESTGGNKNEHNLYITSDVATSVKLTIPGKEYEKRITTKPYGIIKIGFSPTEAQCYRKKIKDLPQAHRVFKGYAIILESDDPIVVYGVTRYQYNSDGFLGVPASGCGMQYVVEAYNDYTLDTGGDYYTSYFSVIGISDKTEVTCVLGGYPTNYTPGSDRWTNGQSRKKLLNKGDVWLVGVAGDKSDVTGTLVESNKPISVISGNYRTALPNSSRDYLIEHMLPTNTWGYKYHVTPIAGRKTGPIIRIFSINNNTIIYRDGEQWTKIKEGLGGEESYGYVEKLTSNFEQGPRPVTISADSRIHVAQYNPSKGFDGVDDDPFIMALTPIDQYQTQIVFCTPGFKGVGFKNNYMNLCYKSTVEGQIPKDMEFGEGKNGNMYWKKLYAVVASPGESFIDPSITDGREWKMIHLKLTDPEGVYALRSETPFAAYGYGAQKWDSYGYPLSAALKDISIPDIWAPKVSYSMTCQGEIEGTVYDEPRYIDSLRSNLSVVALSNSKSYNYELELINSDKFIPGVTIEMDWLLHIQDIESDAKAVMLFNDRAGNDTTIIIEYKRTAFSISPRITNWGQIGINNPKKTLTMTLKNKSEKEVVVDSIILLSSAYERQWDFNGFIIDDNIYKNNILPKVMQEEEELEFNVTFDVNSVKDLIIDGKVNFLDSIGIKAYYDKNIGDYCYYKYKAAIKATTGQPYIEVDSLGFGEITVNETKEMDIPIFNHGSSDLNITGYSLPKGFDDMIYIPELDGLGPNDAFTIPAKGGYKLLYVVFKPNKVAQFPDRIIFESDADTSYENHDPICELMGAGVMPGLQATGTEWKNMRVHLPVYDKENNPYGNSTFPYDITTRSSSDYGVKLYNDGTQPVEITNIYVEDSSAIHPEYFRINGGALIDSLNKLFIGQVIDTGIAEIKKFLVSYNPLTAGNHYVKIIIEGDIGNIIISANCEFIGNAIYPNAITNNYMFTDTEYRQTAIIGDREYYEKEIVFINDGSRGASADTLTIYDIKTSNQNLISFTGVIKNEQVFAFNKNTVFNGKSNIKLKVNEELKFTARFYPNKTGGHNNIPEFNANLIFVTDADTNEYISNWRAKSVKQETKVTGLIAEQCRAYSANPADSTEERMNEGYVYSKYFNNLIYPISISNIGKDTLFIDTIRFIVSSNLFEFVDKNQNTPFFLLPDSTEIIQVYFSNPYVNHIEGDNYLVFHTKNKFNSNITTIVDAKTILYKRTSKALINNKEYNKDNIFPITYEKYPSDSVVNKFTYTIQIDKVKEGLMDNLLGETNYEVVIEYDRNFLGVDFDNDSNQVICKISDQLANVGYTITSAIEQSIDIHHSRIIIQIENDGNIENIYSYFDLLSLNFTVYQNEINLDVNPDLSQTIINHAINNSNLCLNISGNKAELELKRVCAQNTRLINIGNDDFKGLVVTPNPVSGAGAKINYELGFECFTTISVYNEEGKLISIPVKSVKIAGKHSTHLNTNNLSSGVYLLKLTAGPFESIKRIIINK